MTSILLDFVEEMIFGLFILDYR
jgi:hypothetical protein